MRGILKNPNDKTNMTLVFGINSDKDLLCEEDFREWERTYPGRVKLVFTARRPEEGSALLKGYVTKELLQEVMPKEKNTKVFVCGPPAMEGALLGTKGWDGSTVKGILEQLSYGKEMVYKF